MNYEEKYKNALKRARECMKDGGISQNTIDYLCNIFPELAEAKDEKIRKGLIENFKWFCGDFPETTTWGKDDDMLVKDIITWLEKQCERNLDWSEEDERNLKGIIDEIEANKNQAPDYDLATYDRFLHWLKSLRLQNKWKPSDEQIKAIRLARSFVTDDFGDNPTLSEILIELEKQLKKLKGGEG